MRSIRSRSSTSWRKGARSATELIHQHTNYVGDGARMESEAPFDAIIVTAAARDHVPHPLIQQLKDGGRIVIPIGPPGAVQTLWRFTKRGDTLDMENWGLVRFVPLVRK